MTLSEHPDGPWQLLGSICHSLHCEEACRVLRRQKVSPQSFLKSGQHFSYATFVTAPGAAQHACQLRPVIPSTCMAADEPKLCVQRCPCSKVEVQAVSSRR